MNKNSSAVQPPFMLPGYNMRMFQRFLLTGILAGCFSAVSATERVLAVDFAQSKVEIVVKATVDSFVGRLVGYDPQITVGDDGTVKGARVRFRFLDVETGKKNRDKAMHAWQQTDKFPDGEFVLGSLEGGDGGAYTASGQLTFHGVSRDVRFPVAVTRDGDRYAVDGNAPVDTRDFGLPIIRTFGLLTVNPLVHVRFHLQGTVAPVTTSP